MELDQSIDVKVENVLDKAFLYIATGLFALTIVLASAQVMVRQLPFLNFIDISWSLPVSRFTLIILTYIGGAVVTRNQEHISIDVILNWVGRYYPRSRNAIAIVADLIVIAFLSVAVYSAGINAIDNWTTSVGSVSGITSGQLYLGIGIGLLGMLIYEVQHLIESYWRVKRASEEESENGGDQVKENV